jgi:tetratricopeptide (TPR) repeat protein
VLCGLLALLSKATAMTLPVVLLLLDWFVSVAESHDSPLQKRLAILNKIPFFILSILFAFIALSGKERIVGSTSMIDTSLVAIRSVGHYLWQLFVPIGFSVFYQQRDPILNVYFVVSLISLLSLISLSWYFRNRKPWIAFGFLFYLITLSPTFFNFHKGLISFYAVDRYAYLPSIGIIFLLLQLLSSLISEWSSPSSSGGGGRGEEVISVVGIVTVSILLIGVWDTPASLYTHAVSVDPASVPARATLASVLRQTGRPVEAFNILKEGLQYGDDVSYRLEAGNIYASNGQVSDAIAEFTKASQMKPDLPEPIFSIGNLEEHRGNIDLALEYYRKALALDASYVGARTRIADILIDRKALDEAEEQLREALRWNESSFGANVQMYRLRMAQGREEEAKGYLEKAKALRPGEEIEN